MNLKLITERGQALILIALAIVGVIALTALAIDGGNAFSDRRHAQNAADTAALAAALAKVYGEDWSTAGFNRANSNGYINDGTSSTVSVSNPPGAGCDGTAGPYAGNVEYIQVIIHSNVDTYFAPVIGVNQVHNCVDAVARARPPYVDDLFLGHALVSLAPTACSSYWVHGTGDVRVYNSGIFVNSNCCGADPDENAFRQGGSGVVEAPYIEVVGCASYNPADVDPDPTLGATPFVYPPEIVWPEPTCAGAAVKTGDTLSPGNWNGPFPPAGVTTLLPGTYCVNGEFRVNSGDVLTGHDVLIYMIDGRVRFNGGATINLDAPDTGPFAGLLLYLPMDNSDEVLINGNSDSHFTGTVFAPASNVNLAGTGDNDGFHCQVIGYTLETTGTADMNIYYNDGQNYDATYPPSLELTE